MPEETSRGHELAGNPYFSDSMLSFDRNALGGSLSNQMTADVYWTCRDAVDMIQNSSIKEFEEALNSDFLPFFRPGSQVEKKLGLG